MAASRKHHDGDLVAQTCRMPQVLYIRAMDDLARRRKNGERKLSMGDWLNEAAREKLDGKGVPGPEQRSSVKNSAPQISGKSGSENMPVLSINPNEKPEVAAIRAKVGIKTLATIEEVEPRMDSDSGYISVAIQGNYSLD